MRRAASAAALAAFLAAVATPATAGPRIVSLGGAATETVWALGRADELVGIDTTSLFPPALAGIRHVGYVRTLSAEGILSLRPDIVIAAPEAGPPAALAQMEAAGLPVTRLPAGFTPAAALARITAVGRAVGTPEGADALRHAVAADLEAVAHAVARTRDRPRVLFLLQVGRGAPLVSGAGTAADAMIALAGGENVVAPAFHGYRPLSPEAAVAAAPDVLLTTTESVEAMGGEDAVLADPALAATPAASHRRLVALEALYLLGFGPRTAHALRDLAAALHPGADIPPLPARPWTRP